MSRDTRFRILDYQREIAGAEIISRSNVLWPCHAIKVIMPARRKRSFDVFEETVLRFAAMGKRNTKELASLTCLDEDLLEFILNRLEQNKMLDEKRILTSDAKKYLGKAKAQDSEVMAATIFVELLGGKLLPVILGDLPSFSEILEIKGRSVKFLRENYSERPEVWASMFIPKKDKETKTPSPDEVAKVAIEHKSLHRRHALLSKRLSFPSFKGVASAITVSSGKDLVYLHTELVLQKGEFKHEVMDPFGYGFSEQLLKVHSTYVVNTPGAEAQVENLRERAKTVVEPSISQVPGFKSFGPHKEVRRHLRNAEKHWQDFLEMKGKWRRVDERNRSEQVSHCSSKLYSAIEWVLRHFVATHSIEKWVALFTTPGNSHEDNNRHLTKYAEKIGILTDGRDVKKFLAIGPGKFRHVLEVGSPEMEPLFGLVLALTAHEGSHPFNKLAESNPNMLSLICSMKKLRDPGLHGIILENAEELSESLAGFRKLARDLVRLLPGVVMDTQAQEKSGSPRFGIEDAYNRKLEAYNLLEKRFGYQKVHLMEDDLRLQLVDIEVNKARWSDEAEKDEVECSNVVINLASALQIAIHYVFKTQCVDPTMSDEDKLTLNAEKRALKSGFKLEGGELPGELRTVNSWRIKMSLRGLSMTLGANLIALLLMSPKELLSEIARKNPTFVTYIGEILSRRRHANRQIHMPREEIKDLINKSYAAIEQLREA